MASAPLAGYDMRLPFEGLTPRRRSPLALRAIRMAPTPAVEAPLRPSERPDHRPAGPPDAAPPLPAGPVVVAVQGPGDLARAAARSLTARLRALRAGVEPVVLVSVQRGGEMTLEAAEQEQSPGAHHPPLPAAASQGAIPGNASPLGPLLREGVARSAAALVIVAAEAHDESIDWLDRLVSPVLDDACDFVCPAYRRHRTDGAINTGIVAPLVRTLYGQALRQPLGTEAALSADLARRLLADEDWRRRPGEAGSDAWLISKVLGEGARVAQAWLGAWPRPSAGPEDLGDTLVRALGMVFGEMERTAARWQRTGPSRPEAILGEDGYEPGGQRLEPARLFEAFALGLEQLLPIWSLVLPPETLLALQRHAAGRDAGAGLPDAVWARVVFDFAVAHMTRSVERGQLLRSMAPLYLGWLAGLAREAATLDDAGFGARVEAIGAGFEREKRYLVARWRWPDEFNP